MKLYRVSMVTSNEDNTPQNRLYLCRCNTCAYIDSAHTCTVHRLCCTAANNTSRSKYLRFCMHWTEETVSIRVLCFRSDMCFDAYLHDLHVTVAVLFRQTSSSHFRTVWQQWFCNAWNLTPLAVNMILFYFKLPPRCKWDRRSSGMLRSVDW